MKSNGFNVVRFDQLTDGETLTNRELFDDALKKGGFDLNRRFTTTHEGLSYVVKQRASDAEETPA